MTIRILPSQVINQIAAGEVIERPASVVRELVDNALDAGSSDILIEIEQGGLSRIAVSDNGSGIPHAELALAFERHATSKLQCFEDLLRLQSMGFRGEALPSIAAVSRVTIQTRSKEEELGSVLRIEGGEVIEEGRAARPHGTRIEVGDLFFNLPARRKFLKSASAEEQRIKNLVKQVAIVRPDVRFRLLSGERELLNFPVKRTMQERAAAIFRSATLPVGRSAGPISIGGLLNTPAAAHSEGSSLTIFVNRRLVQDRMLARAVKDGFGFSLKPSEYPCGFISVELEPEFVDINVHPQKSEVRFRAPQAVFVEVARAVKDALGEFRSPLESQKQASAYAQAVSSSMAGWASTAISEQQTMWAGAAAGIGTVGGPVPARNGAPFRFSNLRYLEQALGCYLLCEFDERLYLVDMHAAHERYNYNLIRSGFRSRALSSQQLLIPVCVEVGEAEQQEALQQIELWRRFAFEIEPFGENSLLVRAVPALLGGIDVQGLVRELTRVEFSEQAKERLEYVVDGVAARLACHASVRSGDKLSASEVYALFANLDSSEFSQACPHGRPVLVSFARGEIEHWFGRDS